MQKTINGVTLKKMLLSAYTNLDENKTSIDALNVFPVPDGDTGTNMTLTFRSAITEVNSVTTNTIEDICVACNRGALKGARGNSGVILSQIFKGMCTHLMSCKEAIEVKDFVKAFKLGSEIAYKAVTKPKEGTILTIIRALADGSKDAAKTEKDFAEFLSKTIIYAEKVLQQTPDMLPVLKQAGVVDAGGRGLIVILDGMYRVLTGESVEIVFNDNVVVDISSEETHLDFDSLADIEFAYCTELFIINIKAKTTEADIDTLRSKLMDLGDCVICIGDLTMVKIHIHTNYPNKVLGHALQLGEVSGIKIENMLEQNREFKALHKKQLKEYAIIAVAAGEGLSNVFKDLNVDYIVSGGQTMNPSANDIATACDKVKAKNIFVLPNNKNIILAAAQANDITNSNVIVIPTTSIPEGISAALAFDEAATVEQNTSTMTQSFVSVKSGSITYAVRNTETDGFELTKGDIIALDSKAIVAKSNDVNECCVELISQLNTPDTSNITIFAGIDVSNDQLDALVGTIEKKFVDYDVVGVRGDQPIYYYLVSVE